MIEILIHHDNPLSTQLQQMTGDSYNTRDWITHQYEEGELLVHIKTGLRVHARTMEEMRNHLT